MLEPVTSVARAYSVRQPIGGPRVRLGTLWFLLLMGALALGSGAVTLLFTAVSTVAALQVAAAWRARKVPVNQPLAAVGAALVPLGAWWGNRGAATAILLFAVAAVVLGASRAIDRSTLSVDGLRANLPTASATLRSGLFVGLAAGAVVQVHRVDAMALLYLLSVVCVYDSGDYLIGTDSTRRFVGPVAGLLGVAVVVLAMTAINPPPLESDAAVVWLGLVTGLSCPLGQMFGSWTLPSPRAKAPALRRLDAWLVAAPVFLVGLWLVD